jgi:putative ABC transport system ATP-binding protein
VALIEIRGLTKLYRMGTSVVRALDGVDLDIERGEFVAITGPSGSGKSTMMHLLGCLDRPTSGRFVFDGRDVGYLSDRQLADIRNRQIGFVFQTFNLINRMSALENVAVPLFYARRSGTHVPAQGALERVGLVERATHRSNELSGGERQRVAIARAIVNNPLLVLADEPTGNLDSRTGQQIMDIFRWLNEQGVTVALVTHEYDVAIQTHRIVQMHDGRVISDRSTEDVLRDDGGIRHLQARSAAALSALGAHAVPEAGSAVSGQATAAASVQARPAAASGAATPGAPVVAPPTWVAAEPTVGVARPVDEVAIGPRRLGRGANAALVLSVLAALMFVGAIVLARTMGQPQFKPGEMPPRSFVIKAMGAFFGMLVGVVLGIIGLVVARRAGRRMREEPGNWYGTGRTRVAWWLGWLTVLAPVWLSAASWLIKLMWGRR